MEQVKGKAVPLQAWSSPEGSRKLRFPDFLTMAQGGGKVSQVKKGDRVEKWRPRFGHEMLVNRITQHERPRLRTSLQSATPADYSYQITHSCAVLCHIGCINIV
jgi:hypothetical protein